MKSAVLIVACLILSTTAHSVYEDAPPGALPEDEFESTDDVDAVLIEEGGILSGGHTPNPDTTFGNMADPAFSAEDDLLWRKFAAGVGRKFVAGGHAAVNDPAFTPKGAPLLTGTSNMKNEHPMCAKACDALPKHLQKYRAHCVKGCESMEP